MPKGYWPSLLTFFLLAITAKVQNEQTGLIDFNLTTNYISTVTDYSIAILLSGFFFFVAIIFLRAMQRSKIKKLGYRGGLTASVLALIILFFFTQFFTVSFYVPLQSFSMLVLGTKAVNSVFDFSLIMTVFGLALFVFIISFLGKIYFEIVKTNVLTNRILGGIFALIGIYYLFYQLLFPFAIPFNIENNTSPFLTFFIFVIIGFSLGIAEKVYLKLFKKQKNFIKNVNFNFWQKIVGFNAYAQFYGKKGGSISRYKKEQINGKNIADK